MVAITPNAGNHAGLAAKASRFVNVFDLPWEKTKFPGVEAKTLLHRQGDRVCSPR